jgi:putative transposase
VDTPKAPILLELFDRAIPRLFFDQLRERLGMPARGIYSLAVVVWLMMWQRLDGRGSLATAVQQVVQGALGDLVPLEKRVLEQRVSSNTGALSRARKRLPLKAVEAVCDEIFTRLMESAEDSGGLKSRLFLVDGSTIRLAHTAALKKAYPLAGVY